MALKWTGVLVASIAATLCVTTNVLVATLSDQNVPAVVNIVAVVGAGTAIVVAVFAELYTRLDTRLDALTKLVVTRFDEVDVRAGDHNSGFVEGYLLSQEQEATVVPLGPRSLRRRAVTGGED
jgi:predicted PurR-regulated permease PerM